MCHRWPSLIYILSIFVYSMPSFLVQTPFLVRILCVEKIKADWRKVANERSSQFVPFNLLPTVMKTTQSWIDACHVNTLLWAIFVLPIFIHNNIRWWSTLTNLAAYLWRLSVVNDKIWSKSHINTYTKWTPQLMTHW